MWTLALSLIPVLLPMIAGVILAMIFKKPRSDMLALLASSVLLLIAQMLLPTVNIAGECSLLLSREATTTMSLMSVLASVSMLLLFPYMLARWGVQAVDHFRDKHHAPLRQQSGGNLIVGILFGVSCVSILALTLPPLIETGVASFHKARQESLQKHGLEKPPAVTHRANAPR